MLYAYYSNGTDKKFAVLSIITDFQ